MGLGGGLRSSVSFLTIIPAGFGTIEEMARYSFFFPLIGAVLGLVLGLVGKVLFFALPQAIAGWLLLGTLALLTGLNHMDGLFDLGDALMIRGTKERKLEILHDKHHGVGSFFLLFFILVLTQSLFLSVSSRIIVALVVSETLAKTSMVLMGCIGRPGSTGLGAIFVKSLREHMSRNLILSIAIALVVSFLAMRSILFVIPFAAAMIFSVLLTKFFERSFGCITGDMFGSQGELTRVISLLVFVAMAVH
jgi:adenosylcobinamide-GDP ribazoletransferase